MRLKNADLPLPTPGQHDEVALYTVCLATWANCGTICRQAIESQWASKAASQVGSLRLKPVVDDKPSVNCLSMYFDIKKRQTFKLEMCPLGRNRTIEFNG